VSHLTAADVGRRVTVRRTIDDDPHHLGDVVGELVGWTEMELLIRRWDGTTTVVPHDDVVAGRVVTVGPMTTPTVAELEEIAARGWPSPDTAWLGRWWLRAAGGFTGRANAVIPLGSPELPFDAALSRVVRWYEDRALPARFLVEIGSSLDHDLAARGWVEPKRRYGGVLFQTTPMAPAIKAVAALTDPTAPAVAISEAPSNAWLASYRDGAALDPTARAVLADHPRVRFAELRDGDRMLAFGRVVVDDRWAGVSAVTVEPGSRRRGLGTAVVRRLLSQAWQLGARHAYLQVEEGNTAAIRMYARLGFTTHHRYHYVAPAEAAEHRP
jgi:N-acetylglutamate synthase